MTSAGVVGKNRIGRWTQYLTYLAYKGVDENPEKLKLAKAMLIQEAADWLEGLDASQKSTFDQLREAFERHHITPTALRFRSTSEMSKKRQAATEMVDAYAARIRSLSKKVAVADSTLLYAFVSGLKPQIATFVLGRNPETMHASVSESIAHSYLSSSATLRHMTSYDRTI